MATPAVIVVVTVAITTLATLGIAVLVLIRHLQGLVTALRSMQEDLQPTLESLAADVEITQRELERVSEAAAQLGEQRPDDAGRRDMP